MSFSRPQQGHFRTLVAKAWAIVRPALPDASKAIERNWYEDQLAAATGHRSTKDCDAKRDFEKAMAHFEAIVGDSFYWTHRLFGADKRRIIHVIRDLCADADIEENYMRGIARRMLGRDLPPTLEQLDYDELAKIRIALSIHLRRALDTTGLAVPAQHDFIDEPGRHDFQPRRGEVEEPF